MPATAMEWCITIIITEVDQGQEASVDQGQEASVAVRGVAVNHLYRHIFNSRCSALVGGNVIRHLSPEVLIMLPLPISIIMVSNRHHHHLLLRHCRHLLDAPLPVHHDGLVKITRTHQTMWRAAVHRQVKNVPP